MRWSDDRGEGPLHLSTQSAAEGLVRGGLAGLEEGRSVLGDSARQPIPRARRLFICWLAALEAFGVS